MALSAFAEHAAIALDNARLLGEHEHRAKRDPLTGLLNHREFREALASAVADAEADPTRILSVVVLDLDRFKEVNDREGHAAGDRVLRASAAALTSACRAGDAAFRIGGDEFALLLSQADRDDAIAVAARAATAIDRLVGATGVSWGVGAWPDDGSSPDRLITAADGEMYRQKDWRRGAVAPDWGQTGRRLAVASRLATSLSALHSDTAVAAAVVRELHSEFGYYLAVVQHANADGMLRVVAGAGPLAESDGGFLVLEQPISSGVNGRVARTGKTALIQDTRLDQDYLRRDPRTDPGSELSLPIVVDGVVWGVLNLEQLCTHGFDVDDVLLAEAVVAQMGAALHRCALVDELERSFATTLGVLCDVLETKDPYTADHAQQVASLAQAVARRLELDETRLRPLSYCGLLHDIGKIGVRSELLSKPGPLTTAEYDEIKEHSAIGDALLSRIPMLTDVAPLVRAVHERWDGRGYPDGLRGSRIPLEARIVAVCDAWHAMISDRPYRRALLGADALTELRRSAGTQFDPAVVTAFMSIQAPR
ncbi:MAG: HD domain-containing phosphohydrolase [Solirubrobacteraceae bacterium]